MGGPNQNAHRYERVFNQLPNPMGGNQSLLAALREGDTDEQVIMLTKNYPVFASKPDFLILSGVHVSRAAKKKFLILIDEQNKSIFRNKHYISKSYI